MAIHKLLIANRGEIAIRIANTAAELGIATVAICARDDAHSLHCSAADSAVRLEGEGPSAYLDIDAVLAAAKAQAVDAIHPGYGFLAENAQFAKRCAQAGVVFVGPSDSALQLFGDKSAARELAKQCEVPVLNGTHALSDEHGAARFLQSLGDGRAMMLKAVAGGGGRGMRVVRHVDEVARAFKRAQSEARNAFGDGALYAEELFENARHIEVQIIADGMHCTHAWDRDCSIQRQRQKVIEVAPAFALPPELREQLLSAALRITDAARLNNIATVEFLVDADCNAPNARYAFIECNARIQVEHTVTEEITGLDLVATQLQIASGMQLEDLGLSDPPAALGHAIQLRINTETMRADGSAAAAHGTLKKYQAPAGKGIRIDGCAYAGYTNNPNFDSLLAKLIVYARDGDYAAVLRKAQRALAVFEIDGIENNIAFLLAALDDPQIRAGAFTTELLEARAETWLANSLLGPNNANDAETGSAPSIAQASNTRSTDPLAVIDYGKRQAVDGVVSSRVDASVATSEMAPGILLAPTLGTVVEVSVAAGQLVQIGDEIIVMEAMKMEHVVAAIEPGLVREIFVQAGSTLAAGDALARIETTQTDAREQTTAATVDLDHIRPDLAELFARRAKTLDAERPQAVSRRRKTGQRTVRENVIQLLDEGSFVEYGALTLAARRLLMEMDELIDRTPADGLVCGVGQINGALFDDEHARAMVVAYDYTVLAGTQGKKNHQKKDRMFELAHQWRLPLVLFAEGGGGRPGDTDVQFGANLQVEAFHRFGKLSGLVPLIGIASGRCFAGNAVLLGCCDVVIATANATIGMGGPAMIEGGGLGVFTPEEVGPLAVQVDNGVVDIAVADEQEAICVAQKYLSYFQGVTTTWDCADQRILRHLIPENRLRVYDVRSVIEHLADIDSVLELRAGYGHGIVTALIRIEGRPMGLIANNPMHLGGAIDSDAADKAARFMQLCDAFDLPILSLCDTPGNMVGPEHERTALVRHCCRMFVIGANITVPLITVVLRKGYGLGAQGMAGGSFHAPLATLSWPTGEFGGMGLEGAVKLGFRDQLAAITDPAERLKEYQARVAEMYERGKAISISTYFELDDVIDPAETRARVVAALRAVPKAPARTGKKRTNIDTW
jgi:acetyl/propionyl-CoA carboxylase alpha subunit